MLSVSTLSERNFNLYVFTGGGFTGGKFLLDSGGREATGRVGFGIEITPLFGIEFDYIPIISDLDTDKDAFDFRAYLKSLSAKIILPEIRPKVNIIVKGGVLDGNLEANYRGDNENEIDLGLKYNRTEVSAGGGLLFNRTGAVSCEFLFYWILTDEFDLGDRRKP